MKGLAVALAALALSGCGDEHRGTVRRAVPRSTVSGGGCEYCSTTTTEWCRVYLSDGWHCDDGTDDCEGIEPGQMLTFGHCWGPK